MSNPAVFFDRDGTLIELVDYICDPSHVRLIRGARASLARLKEYNFERLVITNQSGIGRGYFTKQDYGIVHAAFLKKMGADLVTGTYYCADPPDAPNSRRKPSPAMVLEAQRDHDLDLERSFFIGDNRSDIECGRAAGLRTILVETGHGAKMKDCGETLRVPDVGAAVDWILDYA